MQTGQATKASTNCVMFCNSHAFCGASSHSCHLAAPSRQPALARLGLKVAGVCLHPLDVAAAPAVLAPMLFSRQFSVMPFGERESFFMSTVDCSSRKNPERGLNPTELQQ